MEAENFNPKLEEKTILIKKFENLTCYYHAN